MANLHSKFKDHSIEPLDGLWGSMSLFLKFYMLFEIAIGIGSAATIWLFWQLENEAFGLGVNAYQIATAIDVGMVISNFGFLFAFVLCVFSVALFSYRAMKNLHIINANNVDMSPLGTVLWHFVPIVNWFKPFSGMSEIWRGSKSPDQVIFSTPSTMTWWWIGWVLTNILGNVSFRLNGGFGKPDNEEVYQVTLWIDVASSAFGVLAAIMLLQFTKQIVKFQNLIAEDQSSEEK